MAIVSDAPWVLGEIWALTTITLIVVLLRIYTRVRIVHRFGIDDMTYITAYLCLLLFAIFITAAAYNGFASMTPTNPQRALLYEVIGQNFVILCMAVSKCSLGFFLLRVALERWQRFVIWGTIGTLLLASLICLLCFWLRCHSSGVLDVAAAPACRKPMLGAFIFIGVACVVTDLFFATFPWVIFWRLQMPAREKSIVLGSMSLGFIGAIFGIKRTTLISSMLSSHYLQSTVELIAWSAAEMSVTLICIGVPILRPLYKKRLNNFIGQKEGPLRPPNLPFPLYTIGGSPIVTALPAAARSNCSPHKSQRDRYSETTEREGKIALTGPYDTARAVRGRNSDEEALVGQQPALCYLEERNPASSDCIHVHDEHRGR